MKRLPSLLRSTPPSPRTPSVTRMPHHARRPDHAGRMKLHELHVQQFRAGVIGERLAVAGVFPGIAGDLVGAPDAAGGDHHGLGLENLETAAFAVVAERAGDAVAVLEQRDDRVFHVNVDALMNAVVLQACESFPSPVRSPTWARRG